MRRPIIGLVALALLATACAAPRRVEPANARPLPASNPGVDRQVHVDMIRRMLDQDQYYAALAHIEAQTRAGGNSSELRLMEAEARRKLGQNAQAQAIYNSLLPTALQPQANHGLGLLLMPGNAGMGIAYLQRAVQGRPTDIEMRNDLGFALMSSGRYQEAMTQLSTAVELSPQSSKSRNNLVILLLLMRDEASVQRIVRQAQIDADTLAGLRRQAQLMSNTRGTAPRAG